MPDNTSLGVAVGDGDDIRTIEKGVAKTQAVLIDKGGTGAESLISDANPMPISATELPLPTGAASDGAAVTGQSLETGGSAILGWLSSIRKAITDRLGTLGQKTMAGSAPVTISSDQSAVPVSGPLTDAQLRATAVPVSGTVTASGPLTDAQLRATAVPVSGTVALDAAALAALETITIASVTAPLAAGDNNIGNIDVASLPTHSTVTNPAQTAVGTTAGTILAANAGRKRFMVQNTGTTIIKLVLGAQTPTQTAYHVALAAGVAADDGRGAIYVDDAWTGAVQAISSAASGSCVITEVT